MGSRLDENSAAVRKRIEKHKFNNEEGEEYEPSKFGGFNDYFRRKKIKLQNLDAERRSSSVNNPPIFKGVVAHVNGYTQPSLNDLHSMIVSYGGGFMQYLDGKTTVTHIIASNLTPKKKVEFARYRIVKPAWVVDSITAGKLLPWGAYRVVDEGIGQRVLGFENGNITSQVNGLHGGYKGQTDASWYTGQIKGVADELNARDSDPVHSNSEASPKSSKRQGKSNGSQDSIIDLLETEFNQFTAPTSSLRPSSAVHGNTNTSQATKNPFERSLPDGRSEQTLQNSYSPYQVSLFKSAIHPEDISGTTTGTAQTPHDTPEKVQELGNTDDSPHTQDPAPSFKISKQNDVVDGLAQEYWPNDPANASDELPDQECENEPSLMVINTPQKESVVPQVPTAEEHNALLLADPRVRKSTVVNPEFLKQYYEESRLHHLSAWKADLKSRLQKLAAEKTSSQKTKNTRVPGARRYILHVDFDSFFAAVSLRRFPQYVDKPVVVAHGGGSGSEIASCNYPARKFGIKNGMWMKHAQKMCQDLKVLPYDFPAYEDASRNFYDAIMDTGGIVQSVSVDEALLDVSAQCIAAGGHEGRGVHEGSIWREQARADDIAMNLRNNIKEKTGCAVSVGIGGNILLAKVALRKAKPAGQHHLKPEDALDFLGGLTVQELPGVAYSIGGKLEEIGVKFVKDMRELSKERMITTLGPKTGEKIWDYSRGIDRTEVGEQVIRKSVSAEVNWGIRFVTQDQAEEFVESLCEELQKRLVTEQVKGRQLTLKIMRRAPDAPLDPPKHLGHGKCDTFNRSLVLGVATNDKVFIAREAISILRGFGFSPGELRGLGVQMQKLEPLKGTIENPQDSSQKKLQFKSPNVLKPCLSRDNIMAEDIESPQKPKTPADPHPAAAFAENLSPSGKSRTPLNTLGTQFVIPTQLDPEVVKELPQDIRAKLFLKPTKPPVQNSREGTPAERSRSNTPALPADAIPPHSQLDKETLNALPEDVRAEILAFYPKSPHKPLIQAAQARLPQSPHKNRLIKLPKKLTTPTKKRGRGRPAGSKNKPPAAGSSTLTQSNFVPTSRPASSSSRAAAEDAPGDIPDDVLAALPEDIRQEVLAQARRDRLQRKGGIDFTRKRKRPQRAGQHQNVGQRTLTLPERPPRPTFTAQKFTKLPDLREAITSWFEEFQEDGPYAEDMDALVKYLRLVAIQESDMDKAVSVVRWLDWVVSEEDGNRIWREAVEKVKDGVQSAVGERGLGQIEF